MKLLVSEVRKDENYDFISCLSICVNIYFHCIIESGWSYAQIEPSFIYIEYDRLVQVKIHDRSPEMIAVIVIFVSFFLICYEFLDFQKAQIALRRQQRLKQKFTKILTINCFFLSAWPVRSPDLLLTSSGYGAT